MRAVRTHPGLHDLAQLQLDLLQGRTALAHRDRIEDHGNGDYVWVGRIEGEPLSRVTLASRRGVVVGSIDIPGPNGGEAYQLVPTPAGVSVLMPATASALVDGCGGAVPTPLLPADAVGTGGSGTPTGADALVPNPTNLVVIDVMVVYTPATAARYGTNGIEAMILQAIADANTGYANSQVFIALNLVYMGLVTYTEAGDMYATLAALQSPSDGVMDEVHTLRAQYGADLVSLVDEDASYCGLGYMMSSVGVGFAPYAFNVVNSGCLSYYSLHHEMGHNMGCNHDRANAGGGGAYPYSYGYSWCTNDGSAFRSVMSYACVAGYAPRLNYFSNPNLNFNGWPAGVAYETDALNAADNARSLNNTATTVAAFMSGPLSLPAAPSQLAAVAVTFDQIVLTWTDNSSNEAGFKIEWSSDGVAWSELASLAADTVQFADPGLPAGSAWYYRVRAFNGMGCSDYSATASATTPWPIAPTAPANLTAIALSGTQVGLAWTDLSTNETGFQIERSTVGLSFALIRSVVAGAMVYTDTSASPGQTYSYRVSAFNTNGVSKPSNVASVTTPERTAPAAPANLTAIALSGTQVSLAWTDLSTNETGFQIERSTAGASFAVIESVAAGAMACSDTSALAGQTYSYRVSACNANGVSKPSNVASVTTPEGTAPVAPSNLAASALSPTQIKLTWRDKSSNERGFQIERSLDGRTFAEVAAVAANVTTYTNGGLLGATKYYYRVQAWRIGIESAYSSTVNAVTQPPPPSAPGNLTAMTVSRTQINLAWTDNSGNETGFNVERSTDGVTFTKVTTTAAGVTTYANTKLTAGKAYYYRVRSINATGTSAPSNVASAKTLP